jgi:hypothetical protein
VKESFIQLGKLIVSVIFHKSLLMLSLSLSIFLSTTTSDLSGNLASIREYHATRTEKIVDRIWNGIVAISNSSPSFSTIRKKSIQPILEQQSSSIFSESPSSEFFSTMSRRASLEGGTSGRESNHDGQQRNSRIASLKPSPQQACEEDEMIYDSDDEDNKNNNDDGHDHSNHIEERLEESQACPDYPFLHQSSTKVT